MICGYARVSTKYQKKEGSSLEAQEEQLKAAGAKIVFKDSYSGATLDRPQFKELRKALEAGDTLMVTKLDRLARSATTGIELIDDLLSHGIKVHVLNMGLMDNTPTGKLIRTILLAFAEFERYDYRTNTRRTSPIWKSRWPPQKVQERANRTCSTPAPIKLLFSGV